MIVNWVLMWVSLVGALCGLFLVGVSAAERRVERAVLWAVLFAFNVGGFVLNLAALVQATP